MGENDKLKVLYIEPMKTPKIVEIDGDLESMQNLVGGYIEEYMPFEDEVAIVCNDEGKINGLEPNRGIFDKEGELQDIICGPFFICYAPVESEKYLSLPDNLRKKYEEMFRHPEMITHKDDGKRGEIEMEMTLAQLKEYVERMPEETMVVVDMSVYLEDYEDGE